MTSVLLSKEVATEAIQTVLGHTNLKTIQVYIDSINKNSIRGFDEFVNLWHINTKMDKKRKNIYDALVETISSNLQNVENFHLVYEQESSRKLFEFYIFRHHELNLFKKLVISKYLPATHQVIAEETKAIRASKYRHLLKISDEDLKESVYEFMRLAYVGLFHKYENYIDNLLDCIINLHNDSFSSRAELDNFFYNTFGFRLKDWKNSRSLNRINWICICIKHYDGYPLKEQGFPDEYLDYPKDQRIKLTSQNFKDDVESILVFYRILFQVTPQIATLKDYSTTSDYDLQLFGEEFMNDRKKNFEAVKEKILTLFETLKKI